MTTRKERLTVTVDRALAKAASDAVASGRAESLSGWVNLALAERVAKERPLRALAEAVAGYEADHGVISAAEIASQERADRRAAIVARARPATPKRRRGRTA